MTRLNASLALIHDGPIESHLSRRHGLSQPKSLRRRALRAWFLRSLARIAAITVSARLSSSRYWSVVVCVIADIVRCESGAVPREFRSESTSEGRYVWNGQKRGNALVRLLQMIEILRHRRLSILELANEFDVAPRTIVRDLIIIERSGVIPVHRDWTGWKGGSRSDLRGRFTDEVRQW